MARRIALAPDLAAYSTEGSVTASTSLLKGQLKPRLREICSTDTVPKNATDNDATDLLRTSSCAEALGPEAGTVTDRPRLLRLLFSKPSTEKLLDVLRLRSKVLGLASMDTDAE